MTSARTPEVGSVAVAATASAHARAARCVSHGLVACIFAAAFLYGLQRIELDVGLIDEGFALTSPMRLALGDIPFRDEIGSSARMFDLVLLPVFRAFPYVTVYQLRVGWLVVQLASAFALFWVFRRFAAELPLALACGATLWLPNAIWSPSYHVMGTFFLVLGWALWLGGCGAGRRAAWWGLGAVSGFAFFLSALSYLPLAVAAVVPGVVLAHALARRRRDGAFWSSIAHLVAFAVLALAAVGAIVAAGLVGDWMNATNALQASGNYSLPLLGRIGGFLSQLERFPPVVLAAAALVLGMGLSLRGWDHLLRLVRGRAWLLVALLSVIGAAAAQLVYLHPAIELRGLVAMETRDFHHWLRCVSLVVGWHLGALALFVLRRPRDTDGRWWLAYLSVVAGAGLLAGVQGILSSHAFKVMVAILPLAVTGVAAVVRALPGAAAAAPQRALAAVYAASLCVTLGAGIYGHKATYNYQGKPPSELTAAFSHPLLRGIRSDPKKVESIEATLDFLATRVDPGEYFLAFPGIPLFYYLTHTRPAINHSLTTGLVPLWVRTDAVHRMIREGRVPRYAVRGIGNPRVTPWNRNQDPLLRFLFAKFRRLETIGVYEVWERRDLR